MIFFSFESVISRLRTKINPPCALVSNEENVFKNNQSHLDFVKINTVWIIGNKSVTILFI